MNSFKKWGLEKIDFKLYPRNIGTYFQNRGLNLPYYQKLSVSGISYQQQGVGLAMSQIQKKNIHVGGRWSTKKFSWTFGRHTDRPTLLQKDQSRANGRRWWHQIWHQQWWKCSSNCSFFVKFSLWFFVRLLKMVIDKGGTGTVMLADHNSPVATLPDIHSRYIALYQWMGTSTTHVNAEVTVPFGFLKLSYRSIVWSGISFQALHLAK